jgi:hypothetical protein
MTRQTYEPLWMASKAGVFIALVNAAADTAHHHDARSRSTSIYDGSHGWNRKMETGAGMLAKPIAASRLSCAAIFVVLALLSAFVAAGLFA